MGERVRNDIASAARGSVVPLAAAFAGFSIFAITIGLSLVDPTRFGWVMYGGDPEVHFFGWHLYRNGPWSWPLGATPLLRWPVGTSVGLTDSIPIAALVFKPFSPVLPPVFQYLGLWLLCCFVLQGVFAALLVRTVTTRPELQLLGAVLFVMSPPLLNRFSHEALSAHWLIVWALWLTFRDRRRAAVWPWLAVCTIAAATHPYLCLMIGALMLAAFAGELLVAPSTAAKLVTQFAAICVCIAVILWQSGYFVVEAENLRGGRFGYFSMNVLSPLLPLSAYSGPARWFSPLEGQYEGYAYLGAGGLLLCVVAAYKMARDARRPTSLRSLPFRYIPLALTLAGLLLLSLGPQIAAGSQTVIAYDPSWWGPLSLFRASGRMFWPLYYALLLLVIRQAARWPAGAALWILSAALMLQAVDVMPHFRILRSMRLVGFANPLHDPFWEVVTPHYRQLVLFPARMCTAEDTFDYRPFAVLAGRHGLGINTGSAARVASEPTETYCRQLEREIATGSIDSDSLYVLRNDLVAAFAALAGPRARCASIDAHSVCMSESSILRWRGRYELPALDAGDRPRE
jgi:hypothetical protein